MSWHFLLLKNSAVHNVYSLLVCFDLHTLRTLCSCCLGKVQDFPLHMETKTQHISQKRNKEEHSGARPGLYCNTDSSFINALYIVQWVQSMFKCSSCSHMSNSHKIHHYFMFNGERNRLDLFFYNTWILMFSALKFETLKFDRTGLQLRIQLLVFGTTGGLGGNIILLIGQGLYIALY